MRKLRWRFFHHPSEWNLSYFRTAGEWYQATHEHNFESWLKALLPGIGTFPQDYSQYNFDGKQTDQAAQWVRWNEFTGHMGNGMLKVDRGSMYHSLEVRTPILDREVISTALRVDWRSCLDLKRGMGKLPLRRALAKRVKHQTENKRGFTVPMADWLRGPLHSMFQDLVIEPGELLGLQINKQSMKKVFQDHVDGKTDRSWGLWIFMSLALWEKTHYKK
jgi:asparagine synthase (glutamine-hydrolysing)